MDQDKQLTAAKDQLTLILSFFTRVETKLSVILGIDLSLLGVLGTRLPQIHVVSIYGWGATGLFVLLCGLSLWNLYHGSFPRLNGGHASLVYFREIAKMTEARFIDDFRALSAEALTKDLLGQAWRNSEILKIKFACLVWSYRFMSLSVLPWATAIALFKD